ncbi:MAG TPA: hypothetical protein VGM67_01495 [Gemmatimonadaceae bacterium]|jgi:hypothetical protein
MISSRIAIPTAVLAAVVMRLNAAAQQLPPVRPIGPVTHVSTESLSSVAAAVALHDGRVYVNDMTGRRVLLFDPTLAHATVVADSTDATANAYGNQAGSLIRFRGDSALYIDPTSLSMLVLGPDGHVARVMAMPRPGDAGSLMGGLFGNPGVDAHGHLVYYSGPAPGFMLSNLFGKMSDLAPLFAMPNMLLPPGKLIDSGYVIRVDLSTRAVDTATGVRIPKVLRTYPVDNDGNLVSIQTKRDPLPVVDDWAVMPDGSIAVVRGLDFHIDWLGADGHWTSLPKVPFDWQHVSDERKLALIDSAVKDDQANIDGGVAQRARAAGAASSGAGSTTAGTARGGRGGGGGGGSRAPGKPVPNIIVRPELNDLPDYVPPFTLRATSADADGNLWIRTSTVVNGQPVYDIVNHQGALIDRVQLPPYRTIAGFGPGVVYMAVKDSAGVVHLESTRIK